MWGVEHWMWTCQIELDPSNWWQLKVSLPMTTNYDLKRWTSDRLSLRSGTVLCSLHLAWCFLSARPVRYFGQDWKVFDPHFLVRSQPKFLHRILRSLMGVWIPTLRPLQNKLSQRYKSGSSVHVNDHEDAGLKSPLATARWPPCQQGKYIWWSKWPDLSANLWPWIWPAPRCSVSHLNLTSQQMRRLLLQLHLSSMWFAQSLDCKTQRGLDPSLHTA